MARVNESQDRVAANISRTARHKNVEHFCHLVFFKTHASLSDRVALSTVENKKKAARRPPH
jgi:hypothetical protein